MIAQLDPASTLETAATFGWATFVLVLVILVISFFLWMWITKVAVPRLDEERRHNKADEQVLRDLASIIRDLKRTLITHETIARRSERYFKAMTHAKRLELEAIERIGVKIGANVSSLVTKASREIDDADRKTTYIMDTIDDSSDEIPTNH